MKIKEKQVKAALQSAITEAGGVRAFARLHDFNPAFISQVNNGDKAITDRLALCLGFHRQITTTVSYTVI